MQTDSDSGRTARPAPTCAVTAWAKRSATMTCGFLLASLAALAISSTRAVRQDASAHPHSQASQAHPDAAASATMARSVKAFPTAEGFGANAVGGRGGRVIEVTNLDDSGPGSLRSCLEASGPRICVFRVSGTITLKNAIRVSEPYLTVAGQTSPGGVQIKGTGQPDGDWGVWFVNGAHDIVVRHLRVRMGGNMKHDAGNNILFYGTAEPGVHDVIVDHCSVSWGSDTQLDWYGSYLDRATFQWNIIAECYMGQHIGGNRAPKNITLHHNLYANLGSRTPLMQHADVFDFRNNVIYNWNGNNGSVFGQFAAERLRFWQRGRQPLAGRAGKWLPVSQRRQRRPDSHRRFGRGGWRNQVVLVRQLGATQSRPAAPTTGSGMVSTPGTTTNSIVMEALIWSNRRSTRPQSLFRRLRSPWMTSPTCWTKCWPLSEHTSLHATRLTCVSSRACATRRGHTASTRPVHGPTSPAVRPRLPPTPTMTGCPMRGKSRTALIPITPVTARPSRPMGTPTWKTT